VVGRLGPAYESSLLGYIPFSHICISSAVYQKRVSHFGPTESTGLERGIVYLYKSRFQDRPNLIVIWTGVRIPAEHRAEHRAIMLDSELLGGFNRVGISQHRDILTMPLLLLFWDTGVPERDRAV
jgi:hypothetical protein